MDKERKHVSDAAAEAITAKGGSMYEWWARCYGVVVLTVAEHEKLLRSTHVCAQCGGFPCWCSERDALRAEVEKLKRALCEEKSEHGATLEMYRTERLRKGREDDVHARCGAGDISSVGDSGRDHGWIYVRETVTGKGREDERAAMADGKTCVAGPRVLVSGSLLRGVAGQLDPRLGLPMPDGDPCEPMSARSVYRWRAMV